MAFSTYKNLVKRTNQTYLGDAGQAIDDSLKNLADRISDVVNVKTFGATGDGTTDDTTFINNAISYATTKSNRAGIIFFPPGDYKLTGEVAITKRAGLVLMGCGTGTVNCGTPGFPRGWDTANARLGTRLFWGGAGAPPSTGMLRLRGLTGITIRDMSLWGSITDNTYRSGTLIRTERYADGDGDFGMTDVYLDRVAFFNADIGFQAGASNENNNDTVVFNRSHFGSLNTGFKCVTEQGLEFIFNAPGFVAVEYCVWLERGGQATLNNPEAVNCRTFVRVTHGGSSTGTILVNCARIDNAGFGGSRGQFFIMDNHGATCNAEFISPTNTSLSSANASTTPLFVVKGNGYCHVDGGRLWHPKIAQVSGSGSADGRFRADNVRFLGPAQVTAIDSTIVSDEAVSTNRGRWGFFSCFGPGATYNMTRIPDTSPTGSGVYQQGGVLGW